MHRERVTGSVETVRVRQMRKEKREHMAIPTDSPRIDIELTLEIGNHVHRNLIACLAEYSRIAPR